MNIILPTLVLAFAAFCVWLTVRIVNRRERWAKRTLAALVAAHLAYISGIGPTHGFACFVNRPWAWRAANIVYRPVALTCGESELLRRAIFLYCELWEFYYPEVDGKILPPGFWGPP